MNRTYLGIMIGPALALLLVGCGQEKSLRSICDEKPELCEHLNKDSWCRYERSDLIRARYNKVTSPTDLHKYELMKDYESYIHCLELAIHVQPKKSKDKRSDRIGSLMYSNQELKKLDTETASSKNPYLLMWHWTRDNNSDAKAAFLALEGKKQLEATELQLALASYYAEDFPKKALRITYHALELLKKNEPIPARGIQGLVSLNIKLKNYKEALVWANVTKILELEKSNISPDRLYRYQSFSEKDLSEIKEQAQVYADQLEDRKFKSPK
ncbi:DUF2989 domain-containing protein [Dongshaea marina]|uniref:DUF2989 domain-containing protein n=1 Tax=Dongshaea marina TaxID=2047966 RepID=UPI000D3ECC5B|nr:DUF2989 domain-containing protein [Dongshaea marina]